MSSSSVGVTDIHTPSVHVGPAIDDRMVRKQNIPVVRMALPANDVSTRWFNAKLFPTDCWPMDDTTFTGYVVDHQY
jgi:hypothetical protein